MPLQELTAAESTILRTTEQPGLLPVPALLACLSFLSRRTPAVRFLQVPRALEFFAPPTTAPVGQRSTRRFLWAEFMRLPSTTRGICLPAPRNLEFFVQPTAVKVGSK